MKYSLVGLFFMHISGVLYLTIQLILFNKQDLILYNFGLFTLSKIPYQIIFIIPVYLSIKLVNKLKKQ